MKKELHLFLTALMFYTRIPCPPGLEYKAESFNRSTKYFPLIGWIVGSISVFILVISLYLVSPIPAIILSLAASIMTTGAFHEDGFADVCDGFGGGWTKEKIMEIMKDSRVGTFGACGLFLILSFKIFLLNDLLFAKPFDSMFAVIIFISAHALSRFIASTFIITHEYVRENAGSKAKAVAKSLRKSDLFVAGAFATVPLILLIVYTKNPFYAASILPAYLAKFFLGRYFAKWIGGYTGDCLGATQQISEIVFLASALVVWKFT